MGLRPGDFVTIDCVHEESRLIAHKPTVVDMDPR
jgi:hypothetical protein